LMEAAAQAAARAAGSKSAMGPGAKADFGQTEQRQAPFESVALSDWRRVLADLRESVIGPVRAAFLEEQQLVTADDLMRLLLWASERPENKAHYELIIREATTSPSVAVAADSFRNIYNAYVSILKTAAFAANPPPLGLHPWAHLSARAQVAMLAQSSGSQRKSPVQPVPEPETPPLSDLDDSDDDSEKDDHEDFLGLGYDLGYGRRRKEPDPLRRIRKHIFGEFHHLALRKRSAAAFAFLGGAERLEGAMPIASGEVVNIVAPRITPLPARKQWPPMHLMTRLQKQEFEQERQQEEALRTKQMAKWRRTVKGKQGNANKESEMDPGSTFPALLSTHDAILAAAGVIPAPYLRAGRSALSAPEESQPAAKPVPLRTAMMTMEFGPPPKRTVANFVATLR
jgi:hypothetical protein